MKTKKLNFSEMKNALSRNEMKKIMAGSGCNVGTACTGDNGQRGACLPFYGNCGCYIGATYIGNCTPWV